MPNQLQSQQQVSFAGGLNAVVSPHNLAPDEVQTTTNVDFSLESGAATPRRGSFRYALASATGPVLVMLARNYGLSTGVWDDNVIPWYAAGADGHTYSGSGTITPVALALVGGYSGGTQTNVVPGWTQYEGYIYIANGTSAFKTNGTATYDWLLPQADTPTVAFIQQGTSTVSGSLSPNGGVFVPFQGTASGTVGTFTATEGSVTGTSTSTTFGTLTNEKVILYTATTGTSSRVSLVANCVGTNWNNPTVFVTLPTGTSVVLDSLGTYTLGGNVDFHQGYPNGDVTGTYTSTATVTHTLMVGNTGTDYILLGLPDQQSIVSIQRDFSIGDASFTNYWHYETTPSQITDAASDPLSLLLISQGNSVSARQIGALNQSRSVYPITGRGSNATINPVRRSASKAATAASISPWGVSRSSYQFIGTVANPDFSNVQAVRVIVEFNTTGKTVVVGGVASYGGDAGQLTDQVAGISYYQTFAHIENGVIVAEGAPSNPSPPQKVQFANAQITVQPTTNTTAGITHRVFYRTGGLLQDAYRVGSASITSGTVTLYDYALPDMLIVNNPIMQRNLWSMWPSPSAGTGLPGVNAVSQPWQDRVWVGVRNQLYWSIPGNISQIQDDSQTTVADSGDNIQAIIPAANLVVVNQASVFEMSGSVFEGTGQDWTLMRTSARRGAASPRTVVNTPYGVLLFGYDGMSFYRSGFGIDQELEWIYEKIGDLWKGTGTADPAQRKGRIPAINQAAIWNSCAAYKDEKLYLAVPTGTNTYADTVFVLDMAHQKAWMYQYPFPIASLLWDRVGNRLFAGNTSGGMHELETGLTDDLANGPTQGVGWSFTTREWSEAADRLMENIEAEMLGTVAVNGIVNSTSTVAGGTLVAASKGWQPAPLSGTQGNNLAIQFTGSQSSTPQGVYELQWDSIPQVPRVTFFQTDPQALPSENYVKTWLADLHLLGTATVTGSVLLDGTVVKTATFTGLDGSAEGRHVYEVGLPNITDGKTLSAIYTASLPFRHYNTGFELEPKPYLKNTWLVTYKKAGGVTQADMARFFAMDLEGTSTATVTTTWLIDGSPFSTNTLVFGATDAGEETGIVRNYMDQIPFPPGARGYLFQQQITAAVPFRVWRASLDIDRIGIKGLSRVTLNGTPSPQ